MLFFDTNGFLVMESNRSSYRVVGSAFCCLIVVAFFGAYDCDLSAVSRRSLDADLAIMERIMAGVFCMLCIDQATHQSMITICCVCCSSTILLKVAFAFFVA